MIGRFIVFGYFESEVNDGGDDEASAILHVLGTAETLESIEKDDEYSRLEAIDTKCGPLTPVPLLEFDLADSRERGSARDARLDVTKLVATERPKVRALLVALLAGAELGEVAARSGYSETSLRKILRRAIDRIAGLVGRVPAPMAAMALSTRRNRRRDSPPEPTDPWEALAEAQAAAREALARSRALELETGWP